MMSEQQFSALAQLVPLKTDAIRRGCYIVLVEGVPEPEAARQVGMTYRALWSAVKRCRVKIELARTVVGQ